jgi:hypothetical protein
LGGDRLLFGEELRVERVLVFAAADELGDGEALGEHAAYHPVDLLFDEVEELLVRHRQEEEQLAPLEVMDDVHALQDRAGAHLPVTLAPREVKELLHGGLFDRLRDRVLEVATQVAYRLGLQRTDAGAVGGDLGPELLREQKLVDFGAISEV